jgi:polysaccharide biosynthesis/export protein
MMSGYTRFFARSGRFMLVVALAAAGTSVTGCGGTPQPSPAQMAAILSPSSPEPAPPYRLQLGDEIDVKFPFQPSMDHHAVIRPDGMISTPGIGEISAAGMTPVELEGVIIDKSKSRLRDPEVTVILTKVGEQRVYVSGEVRKADFVTLRPGMTPMQAVAQCGGFLDSAKLESVLVFMPSGGGNFQAARVDMKQVVQDGVPERIRLAANSVIYVPKTWVAEANVVVKQWVSGLIPALPRVGAGYSLSSN